MNGNEILLLWWMVCGLVSYPAIYGAVAGGAPYAGLRGGVYCLGIAMVPFAGTAFAVWALLQNPGPVLFRWLPSCWVWQ